MTRPPNYSRAASHYGAGVFLCLALVPMNLVNMVNMVNMVNIDSGHYPTARIVRNPRSCS